MSKVKMTKPGHIALTGDLYRRTFDKVQEKNHDYTAGSDDPYANFRLSTLEGVSPEKGLMIRVQDKMQRIRSFIEKIEKGQALELAVKGETVEDAILDVVGYMPILLGLFREHMETTETSTLTTSSNEKEVTITP